MLVRKLAFQMIAALLIIFSVMEGTLAQSAKEPIVTLLDYQLKEIEKGNAYQSAYSFVEVRWLEMGEWHAQLRSFPENNLLAYYFYIDSTRNTKHGRFLSFHANGALQDSGFYAIGKKQGTYTSWYDDGSIEAIYMYYKGLPVDTCMEWYKEGTVKAISITDSGGNGIAQQHYPSGKVKEIGRLKAGKREGLWKVKEESGTVAMEVDFELDTVKTAKCFVDGGKPLDGPCIFEKSPSFPGGIKGWTRFLETKLHYPESAQNANIEGTVKVKFQIAKDGTLSEYEIVSSPHPSLSSEVLRLMRLSPKWEPAIQYNKPVVYRHIQSVTFRLQ